MTALIGITLALLLIAATAVVFTPQPQRQAATLAVYSLLLSVLFLVLQGPDVALSQLGVGTALVPLMILLTLRTMRGRIRQQASEASGDEGQPSGGDER